MNDKKKPQDPTLMQILIAVTGQSRYGLQSLAEQLEPKATEILAAYKANDQVKLGELMAVPEPVAVQIAETNIEPEKKNKSK